MWWWKLQAGTPARIRADVTVRSIPCQMSWSFCFRWFCHVGSRLLLRSNLRIMVAELSSCDRDGQPRRRAFKHLGTCNCKQPKTSQIKPKVQHQDEAHCNSASSKFLTPKGEQTYLEMLWTQQQRARASNLKDRQLTSKNCVLQVSFVGTPGLGQRQYSRS